MSDDDDGRELWRRYGDGAAPAAGEAACPDEAALAAWLDGRAGDAAAPSVEAHLASCARCRAAAMEAREILDTPLTAVAEARLERLTRAVVAEGHGRSRLPAWLPLAAALVLTCGTGFWLGARAAADASAARAGAAGLFGLESLPVVSLP